MRTASGDAEPNVRGSAHNTSTTTTARRSVSVVMPAYNEVALLEASVERVVTGLRQRRREFELLIIENGSTDGTNQAAKELARCHPEVVAHSLSEADYGAALRSGILAARCTYIAIFDVDYYDLEFFDQAVDALDEGDETAIVVGSKRAPGTTDTRAWHRRLVTAGFTWILRMGFGLSVSDTHGMKVLRRAPLAALARACRSNADLFDTELILRAEQAGLAVLALPVTVRELRPSRTPIVRRALRTIVGLVRLRVLLWRDPTPASARLG
jgi:glycosyltransferase involved in cell wall biosynthesis